MFISGVTSRTGRMSTCEPGRNATAPPRSTVKPPLTRPKITPSTRSLSSNDFSSRTQASSRRALSRDSTASPMAFSMRSRNTSTSSPTVEVVVLAGGAEFAQRHAAFGLQAHVDDGEVVLDGNDLALDDAAFGVGFFVEARIEHGREVIAGRVEEFSASAIQLPAFNQRICLAHGNHRRTSRLALDGLAGNGRHGLGSTGTKHCLLQSIVNRQRAQVVQARERGVTCDVQKQVKGRFCRQADRPRSRNTPSTRSRAAWNAASIPNSVVSSK